jgi:peptide/nickel transport system substrate-binding protein
VEGFSLPDKRSDRVVLEANTDYWDHTRFPRVQRLLFDNTLQPQDAVEVVKTGEGGVDLVTGLRPLDTLRVAESSSATVVKNRGALVTVFGLFDMRKAGSPWHDIRLRQAVNVAINRDDLIRYAAKGNGVVVPALVAMHGFGYDPNLAPYPFDPVKTRCLQREAGYANGLSIILIASEDLQVQATVVSKMLEQAGFTVDLQVLDATAYNRKVLLSQLEQPPEQQAWDIALTSLSDLLNFPPFQVYHWYALDGAYAWLSEPPELRRLSEETLRTVDREQQRRLIRQMERHTHDQAYFLFLYSPIPLYAANKAVAFVPYVNGNLNLTETGVTEQPWSVHK